MNLLDNYFLKSAHNVPVVFCPTISVLQYDLTYVTVPQSSTRDVRKCTEKARSWFINPSINDNRKTIADDPRDDVTPTWAQRTSAVPVVRKRLKCTRFSVRADPVFAGEPVKARNVETHRRTNSNNFVRRRVSTDLWSNKPIAKSGTGHRAKTAWTGEEP